jgi:hypothetical protein
MPIRNNAGFSGYRGMGAKAYGVKALFPGTAAHGFNIVLTVTKNSMGMQGRKFHNFSVPKKPGKEERPKRALLLQTGGIIRF